MANQPDRPRGGAGRGRSRPGNTKARRIGDFLLMEEIGRGGMGIVYKARQESLGREVALKVLPSFAGMEPSAVTRFRREAEACARLSHPGIVPVFGVGEAGGIHYYAMELVEGPSLGALLSDLGGRNPARLTGSLAEETGIDHLYPALRDPPGQGDPGARYARSCAAIVADVANALAAAHTGKIIHRDLKPTNIMFHRSGRPVLLDFGLARDEQADNLTRSGDAVGTPSYMAPEQACGHQNVDARVDIYGLGATLYEMLTLRPPFDGAHAGEIMRKILDEDVTPVRRLNPRVPPDLELIVNTCLAKDKDQRYPAIEALEMDLRAFLIGRAVDARPPSKRARAERALRRNRRPILVGAATLVAASIVAITAGVIVRNRSAADGRQALVQAREALLGEHNVVAAEQQLGRATALLGDVALVSGARRDLARSAFGALYPAELALLEQFFASIPRGEDADLDALHARIEGRGRLGVRFEGLPKDATTPVLALRSYRDGQREMADDWTPMPAGGQLRIGEYLLRAELAGHVPVLRRVRVLRDVDSDVVVPMWIRQQVADGTVPVLDAEADIAVAVSASELTRGTYRRFLSGLDDPSLRGEMQPQGWPDESPGDADLPVLGLTFRQARAAAAHLGFHLLTEREYRLAATAGFDLDYPWGGVGDSTRLVADPDDRNQPEPGTSLAKGASLFGVHHLLGNAAEILAPGPGGAIGLAGGHYQSAPGSLRMTAADLIVTLPTPETANAYAGTRLAAFLPRFGGAEVHATVARRRQKILDSGFGSILHDWIVDDQGNLRYEISVSGVHTSSTMLRELPLVTSGFQQIGQPTVRDGHSRVLEVVRRGPSPGEAARLLVRLLDGARQGQGYRMEMATWLRPAAGLVGEGAGYVLRIPVKAAGTFPVVHTVKLPRGCGVDPGGVDPAPTFHYQNDGQTNLVWEFLPDEGGVRTISAVVRFRRDGMLGEFWPDRASVGSAVEQLFEALAERDDVALSGLLDPTFLQTPSGYDFDRTMHGARSGEALWQFPEHRMVDFTAVGSMVTVDLEVDWDTRIGDRGFAIPSWPLRLQLLRDGARYRVVRLMPRGRPDGGVIGTDGSYRHAGLKVVLAPERTQINRTQDELVEMQVLYLHPRDENVRLQVLGMRADAQTSRDAVAVWLTAGAIALRPGSPLRDEKLDLIGPEAHQIPGQSQHWIFGDVGRWTRERWTFVTGGTRHFLIKAVSKGDNRDEALRRFEKSRKWFDAMGQTISIQ